MKRGKSKLLKAFTLLALSLVLMSACNKDETHQPTQPDQELTVLVNYQVDGAALVPSQMIYTNEAGNPFSVHTLNYYLSSFSVQKIDGTWQEWEDIVYLDAFDPEKNRFVLKGIPAGNYQAFKVIIGLEPHHNISNSLPPTVDNINMIWPDMMGGGYHFMKLEGYFKDKANQNQGYAMHLGKSTFHSEALINDPYSIKTGKDTIRLSMDLAEWFKGPNTYDFTIQGNYSMGKDSSMRKLSENGSDVFTFQ